MSALKDQLKSDLTTAIKARDEVTSATIRMVLTAITNEEVAGKEARELSDDDVLTVLGREAKKLEARLGLDFPAYARAMRRAYERTPAEAAALAASQEEMNLL